MTRAAPKSHAATVAVLEELEAARARVRGIVDELGLDELHVLERVAEGLASVTLSRRRSNA